MTCKDFGTCCECGEDRLGIRVGRGKYICGPCHVVKWPVSSEALFSRADHAAFLREGHITQRKAAR